MPPEIKDLATLFLEVGRLDPQHSLYLNEEAPYGKNSLCMVVNNNSEEKGFAAENGFYPVFEIATVQKIVIEASNRLPDITLDELIEAFNFYYEEHDFI
ncbi:MAG: hypothetical protein KJ064_10185 [Anaerolineae bacterium]|nr:hypothetical protein [Anaerolineae bacterium]